MEEMSGGNNKVFCLAGEKMRLTTKSAHTKVKQEVSLLFCRNNLHIAVGCDLKNVSNGMSKANSSRRYKKE